MSRTEQTHNSSTQKAFQKASPVNFVIEIAYGKWNTKSANDSFFIFNAKIFANEEVENSSKS